MNTHTFFQNQLPNHASHCQEECGFSVYRGVLVQWDEDHDERVLSLLDGMPAKVLDQLLVVQEHKAAISFLWKNKVPKKYTDGSEFEVCGGDVWFVYSSTAIARHSRPSAYQKSLAKGVS